MLSHVRFFVNSMDCSPPGSSVHGISQARTLKQVVIASPGDLPNPGIELLFPALAGGFCTTVSPGKPVLVGASPLFLDLETLKFSRHFLRRALYYTLFHPCLLPIYLLNCFLMCLN